MNGNRAQANNYTLDGIDMNETFNNLISYSPAPEALQEVKVMTANSPADYGNVNGGGVVSVLKSGTNQFHGSAYGYVQDYRLNANTWTNNQQQSDRSRSIRFRRRSSAARSAVPSSTTSCSSLSTTWDRATTRAEPDRRACSRRPCATATFPTLLTQTNPIQLYDPQNGFAPYVGDKGIPIVNPVAKFLFANPSLYPLPNATPTDGIAANNYQGPTAQLSRPTTRATSRSSTILARSDKITGFYSMSTAYDGSTPVLAISFPGVNIYPTKLGGANWVHIFSPSLINSGTHRLHPHRLDPELPDRSDRPVRNIGNAKVGIAFPNQAFDGLHLPEHQRRHLSPGAIRSMTAASSTTPTATSTT